ncbi:MAG TPA: twin-arginine translocase TatA/TatE family subunit [Gemmatales bacterium]|nr:twin-arginine translocase TatA/TatE family subunit [Gemmatales bacterium]
MFAWGQIGWMEMIIILGLGVILFGRRLPEVGRYLGKGIVEFKKGIKGIEDDVESVNTAANTYQPPEAPKPPQRIAATAPKFTDENVDSEGQQRYQAKS